MADKPYLGNPNSHIILALDTPSIVYLYRGCQSIISRVNTILTTTDLDGGRIQVNY